MSLILLITTVITMKYTAEFAPSLRNRLEKRQKLYTIKGTLELIKVNLENCLQDEVSNSILTMIKREDFQHMHIHLEDMSVEIWKAYS